MAERLDASLSLARFPWRGPVSAGKLVSVAPGLAWRRETLRGPRPDEQNSPISPMWWVVHLKYPGSLVSWLAWMDVDPVFFSHIDPSACRVLQCTYPIRAVLARMWRLCIRLSPSVNQQTACATVHCTPVIALFGHMSGANGGHTPYAMRHAPKEHKRRRFLTSS